jgi:hypothetical protein
MIACLISFGFVEWWLSSNSTAAVLGGFENMAFRKIEHLSSKWFQAYLHSWVVEFSLFSVVWCSDSRICLSSCIVKESSPWGVFGLWIAWKYLFTNSELNEFSSVLLYFQVLLLSPIWLLSVDKECDHHTLALAHSSFFEICWSAVSAIKLRSKQAISFRFDVLAIFLKW